MNLDYSLSKDLDELNRAIDYLERAVALLNPKTEHVRSAYLMTLTDALNQRFERTENMADLERLNQVKKLLKD